VLRHRFLMMLAALGTLAGTVYLFGLVPKGALRSPCRLAGSVLLTVNQQ
jgi:multidrug efflux pump subunit AcrB